MTPDEARAALQQVEKTDNKMADRMRWPFQRHALFGLAEAMIVMGLGISGSNGLAACGVGAALLPIMIYQDRSRYGMFVSGWSSRKARPLMLGLMAFLLGAIALSLSLRWDEGTNPLVIGLFLVVLTVCTWGSIRWEKLYRQELSEKAGR